MSEDINRMSPESTNELLKKMRAITNDLWRESPDVAAETKEKAKKPEKIVVKSPEIGIDNLWMTADETIDSTDALAHSTSPDGLAGQKTWDFYYRMAERVLSGEVTHCPHGRPVMQVFTRAELDKRFGRIQ